MKRLAMLLLMGGCASIGGAFTVFLSSKLVGPAVAQSPNFTPAYSSSSGNELPQLGNRFEDIALRLSPAVVSVEASKPSVTPSSTSKGRTLEESGSGVIIRGENQRGSLVLTNNHVIAQDRAVTLTTLLADCRACHPSGLVRPRIDVAILKLDHADFLPTGAGRRDRVRVGQWVLAIGSPFDSTRP